MRTVGWYDTGLVSYDEAFSLQTRLHSEIACREREDLVLFQENYPVITAGRSADFEHLLWNAEKLEKEGYELREVSRGGDMTCHCPGQLVISPILHFREYEGIATVHDYLRALEQSVIELLSLYGLSGERREGMSGVWLGKSKLAAVGVAVSHSVTLHGAAVNVNCELERFEPIVACGLHGMGVSSLEKAGIGGLSLERVRGDWLGCFERVFGAETRELSSSQV
ncbi:MAG: lipoyl(octanoyl) transferase LipB [Oscillospiraceae bacterium]|nr:lipoyl(octanoyl) transferase LipB [Oscillospiraceae bacterium]